MRIVFLILIAGIALAACGAAAVPVEPSTSAPSQSLGPTQQPADLNLPTVSPKPEMLNRRVEEFDAYVPPRLIGPDGIRPVYEPRFVNAAEAPLQDDELVIGITLEGEAKAYPITVLRFREMVNDELANLPILVTW